ncbi:MAG: hypothetical protein KDA58_02555 [Planctomycetaceae bacterium]|nr:hypothetical protein [Planctomycetaceae bacterium]
MSTPHEMYDEAVALKGADDLEGAVAKLREILTIAPDHLDTHSALAVYLQKLGQNAEAVTHARKVCELNPQDFFSYTQLSMICMRCGMIPEAEDAKAKAALIRHGAQVKPPQ